MLQQDNKDEENYDELCAICFTKRVNEYKTECNHSFCIECILKWSNTSILSHKTSTCPVCRNLISNSSIKQELESKKINISPESIFLFEEFIKLKGVSKLDQIIILNMDSNTSEWTTHLKDVISEHTYSVKRELSKEDNIHFDVIKTFIKSNEGKHNDYLMCLSIYNAMYKFSKESLFGPQSKYFWVELDPTICDLYDKFTTIYKNMAKIKYPDHKFNSSDRIRLNDNKREIKIKIVTDFQVFAHKGTILEDTDKIPTFGKGNFIFYPKMLNPIKGCIFLAYVAVQMECLKDYTKINMSMGDTLKKNLFEVSSNIHHICH